MKAIILAGGFGTRLKSVVADLPKPMAPIKDKPFLAYLIEYLARQGITEVILSTHYKHDLIVSYFGDCYAGVKVRYAHEKEPLGTGGAMAYAFSQVKTDEPYFVLNGDTFLGLDYRAMYQQHCDSQSDLSIALRKVEDCSRYGRVLTVDGKVTAFCEKGQSGPGLINAGVYLFDCHLLKRHINENKFSFETDFLFSHVAKLKPQAFIADGYFIDIGIPEDYRRASEELSVIRGEYEFA